MQTLQNFRTSFRVREVLRFDCHYFRRNVCPSGCDDSSRFLHHDDIIRRLTMFLVILPWCSPAKLLGKCIYKVSFRHTPVTLYFSGVARCVRSPAADLTRYPAPLQRLYPSVALSGQLTPPPLVCSCHSARLPGYAVNYVNKRSGGVCFAPITTSCRRCKFSSLRSGCSSVLLAHPCSC